MNKMVYHIIGICGKIGSGKDTAANFLVNKLGYTKTSFASSLKDVVAAVFGWDRKLLEGDTNDSRIWRETVDDWWSQRLNIKEFTPRLALQFIGTDLFRNHFNKEIWVASLERKLLGNTNLVISDVRFKEEADMIHRLGGIIILITRGQTTTIAASLLNMQSMISQHESEQTLSQIDYDVKIQNDSDLESLYASCINAIN